jgi:DNA-binding PadR family transcriptional regulator
MRRAAAKTGAGLLALALLAACNTATKPTDKNFIKALNTYFADHNECLYRQGIRFPYELTASDTSATPNVRQLDALVKAGLLTREQEKELKVKRYALTPTGEKATTRFCYGHRDVTTVDSFASAGVVDGRSAEQVTYHYKMMDVPVWASAPEVEKAFPAMAEALSGQAQDKTTLELTMAGWQVPD